MVQYNWLQVYKYAKGNNSKILQILDFIVNKPIPENNYDIETKKWARINWYGDSYLINPEPILESRNHFSDKDLATYVGLASFRNLAEYITTKQKTLPLADSPVSLETIKDNKLLSIVDDKIYFKWEETTH